MRGRAKGTILKGKRILSKKLQQDLDKYRRKISSHNRAMKKIEESDGERKIKLKSNEKDPETMRKLSLALEKLNRAHFAPRKKTISAHSEELAFAFHKQP